MSGTAKGMIQVATSIPEAKAAYLQARADSLEWSNSKTIARVIDFWIALGAPPLSENDATGSQIPIPKGGHAERLKVWQHFVGKLPPASLPVRA